MPSSDLVLNVRQIAGYDVAFNAFASDSVLLQRGLGGPYLSISPATLVGTALTQGGDMVIGGQLIVTAIQSASGQFSNLAVGALDATAASFATFDAAVGTINGRSIATMDGMMSYVDAAASVLQGQYDSATVWSFNQRSGQVILCLDDVMGAGGAPIWSPVFRGCPSAPTPAPLSRNTRIATTEWVWGNIDWSIQNLLATQPFVFSFNGRTGAVTLQPGDIQLAEAALLDSPPLTGTPTAPTAPPLTNNDQLATTAYVDAAVAASEAGLATIYAPINSPAFIGVPTALTADPGTSTGQLATTAFVMNAVANAVAGVATFNGRSGNVVLSQPDITGAGGAPNNSPNFTGTPTAPTPATGASDNEIATCAWVIDLLGTASLGVMTFNGRAGAVTLNTTDITDAGGAPLASPALAGVPTAPTAATGTSNQQIATTAFVAAAIANQTAGVTSFMGRTGAVTLTFADISAAGGLANPNAALTGAPTAPTASPGTNSTQIATTAFVMAQLALTVTSFNGRTGAVSLTLADVTGVGAAPLANPNLTGTPTGPTATAGTSTNQLATTAFVMNAIGTGAYLPLSGGMMTGGGGSYWVGPAPGGYFVISDPAQQTGLWMTFPPGNVDTWLGGSLFLEQSYCGALSEQGGGIFFNFATNSTAAATGPGWALIPSQTQFSLSYYPPVAAGSPLVASSVGWGFYPTGKMTSWGAITVTVGASADGCFMASSSNNASYAFFNGSQYGAIWFTPGNNINVGRSNSGGGASTSNFYWNFNQVGAWASTGGNQSFQAFYSAGFGSVIGTISANAGQTGTAYNTTSDVRLKTDIEALPERDASGIIDGLQPIRFKWRSNGAAGEGFAAQDLYAVYPDAVAVGEGDPGDKEFRPWGVDFSKLVPLLVAEIRALRRRVAAIEVREAH